MTNSIFMKQKKKKSKKNKKFHHEQKRKKEKSTDKFPIGVKKKKSIGNLSEL